MKNWQPFVLGPEFWLCQRSGFECHAKTYRHAQQPWSVVFEREILIGKCLRAVDSCAPCPISIEEVTALDHKVLDLESVSRGKRIGRCPGDDELTTRWNLLPL